MDALPLNVEDLSAGYEKDEKVHSIHFQIRPGEIVGLIGLNGAGKSTTIKTLLGILPKMGGDVRYWGMSIEENPVEVKRKVAYIPELPYLYDELTLWEHLQWVAMAYGLDRDTFEGRVSLLLARFRMEEVKDHFPSSFSKGMRQKVMVLAAFLHDASLYFIDEPFIGLDPLAIRELNGMMRDTRDQGKSLLISTHSLDSAERLCDRFIIMHEGKILFDGGLAELRDRVKGMEASFSLQEAFYMLVQGEVSK